MAVEIYTIPSCPYCLRAKEFLTQKGIAFKEISVTQPEEREALIQKADGRRTVPQIFIDGEGIGGYDDLVKNWSTIKSKINPSH